MKEETKKREEALEMILLLLTKHPPITWRERYALLSEKLGLTSSRFRELKRGRSFLSEAEVQGLKQTLGASGVFVPWEVFFKVGVVKNG